MTTFPRKPLFFLINGENHIHTHTQQRIRIRGALGIFIGGIRHFLHPYLNLSRICIHTNIILFLLSLFLSLSLSLSTHLNILFFSSPSVYGGPTDHGGGGDNNRNPAGSGFQGVHKAFGQISLQELYFFLLPTGLLVLVLLLWVYNTHRVASTTVLGSVLFTNNMKESLWGGGGECHAGTYGINDRICTLCFLFCLGERISFLTDAYIITRRKRQNLWKEGSNGESWILGPIIDHKAFHQPKVTSHSSHAVCWWFGKKGYCHLKDFFPIVNIICTSTSSL